MSIELDATASDPEASKKPVALAAGSPLGKYKLERVLGQGGMGVVWAARDPDLQRSVAIKVLKGAQASPKLRQRLLREAVAMAKLKHPNVLTVYEVGTVADRDYIAMELVEGTTLDAWLSARPPMEEVWSAILAAGRGLAAAHDAGVVHRDFKPHNVMRSRDGRVLVTDFGLARGVIGDDEDAEADAPAPDSLLDTPLTHTGALIGTPAYMALEQFHGTDPDPRTDQFAFCVTAWQAFTGDRPFKGSTLDEQRKAVSAGVLPTTPGPARAIRAVLTRGLDPKPDARWGSLEELLDALVRAERLPRRRMRIYAALVAAGLLAAAFALALVLRPKAVPNACDAPDRAFDKAWSPAIRSQLARAANTPAFDRVAAAFDQYKERWVTTYQKACRTRNARSFPARVGCLDAMADQVNALTVMLQNAPPQAYDHFDAPGMFPQLALCERQNPISPPPLPADEAKRGRVLAMFPKLVGLMQQSPATIDTASAALEQEAQAIGYPPLVARVVVMTADVYLRYQEPAKARAAFKRAEKLAGEAKDTGLEARAKLGVLETSMAQLEAPEAKIGTKLDDPRAEPELHPELRKAISARDSIRDDALLLGGFEMLAASAYMQLGQWNRYRTAYPEALAHAQEARKQFDLLLDPQRSAQAAALEAEIYLARGDDRALDDALFAARRASDALDAAGIEVLGSLEDIRRRVAFARRDYNEVHRVADRQTAQEVSPVTTTIAGKVSPPGRAMVIAWRGDLVGDPRRAYIDPRAETSGELRSAIDIVQANPDGSFAIHAEPGWAIIAEQGDTRSLPQVIGKVPLDLTLRPTVTQSGTVKGKNLLEVRAFARYTVGDATWSLHVPVERDGTFDLRGMPQGGTPTFGTRGMAGHGERVVTATSATGLTWPTGQALELIVRPTQPTLDVTVWVYTSDVRPKPMTRALTRADLEERAAREPNIATAEARWVGASNTDVGRGSYKFGDLHAVITGNPDGGVMACAAAGSEPTAHVRCDWLEVESGVPIDYPDGRFASGMTAWVIEPYGIGDRP